MTSNINPDSLIFSVLLIRNELKSILNFFFISLNWKFSLLRNQKISIRPSRVIRRIFFDHILNELKLSCPKIKMLNQPNTIAPCMIIFGIWDENFFKKLFFHRVHFWSLNDASSMMPKLIVLFMFKSYLIHDWNLIDPEIWVL